VSLWRRVLAGPATVLPRILGRALYTETLPADGRKKSVFVRHVDAGSSNVFELELVALTNSIYDLAQYGIQFVASPRHADVLLITGPLTGSMLAPLRQAFAVMPAPKAIITVGDFAAFDSGQAPPDEITEEIVSLFSDSYATVELPEEMRKAIVAHVPGDPPEPSDIIRALLSVRTLRSR
jgi:Ni,Fe-hydrogenase III small subunit